MKREFVLHIVLLVLLVCANASLAADNVLRLAFNSFPPWKIVEGNGTYGGIDYKLAAILARKMGLELEVVYCPFSRCLKMMEQGNADLMTSLLYGPEREKYMFFIQPPYKHYNDKAFYTIKGKENTIKEYDDLYGLRIGVATNSMYDKKFDNDSKISRDFAYDSETCLQKLVKGRVDAVLITETTGDHLVRSLKLSGKVGKAPFGFRKHQDVYIALSRKSPHISRAAEISGYLKNILEQGKLQEIISRYSIEPWPSARDTGRKP